MKRATSGKVSVHIDASPEHVYDLVSDVTKMGQWSPETVRCQWVRGDGAAVGARFKGYNRRGRARWSNTLEVIVADRGREFAFRRAVLHCGVCDWRYRMEADDTGTTLTESYEVTKPDWAITNWFNGLMLGVDDRDLDLIDGMRTTVARIKAAAEGASPAESPSAEKTGAGHGPGGDGTTPQREEHAMTATTTPNAEVIRQWAEVEGPHYVAEAERYDTMLSAFGEAMLEAADLRAGERVLDVGCGNGATTIDAATRVRPGGAAVGVDVSPPMLAFARKRAEAAGANEAEFLHADAQVHTFDAASFDAVISRHGLMFFDDPDAAFANLARALRPGGRIAFVAPQGMDHSEWIMVAGIAAAPHIGIPEGIAPNAPGPYGLADPDRTRAILQGAGFGDITIEPLTRPMRIGADVDDAVGFLRSIPLVADLFAAAAADKQTAAIDAVREALAPYAGPDGVVMHDNGDWLVEARRIV